MASKLRAFRPLASPSALTQRLYHSPSHPPPPGPFSPTETLILAAAQPHISSHGFTARTLALGATDVGYLPASTNLFPRGAFSLVHYHLHTQRQALAALPPLDDALGVSARVKELVWSRLLGNKDIIYRWQEALALLAMPSNIPVSLHELSLLSDEIWYLAGDKAVDSSWYTKRASLSTVYAATELFMTTDHSPEFADTRQFLERRLRDARAVGGAVGGLGQWVGFTAQAGVNVLRSRGVRI